MTVFSLFIPGIPIPQGSKTARVVAGRAVLYEANKHLKTWRQHLAHEMHMHRMNTDTPPIATACVVQYDFLLARPKTATRKYVTTKPDLDKLARAVNDAATDAQLVADDAHIISLNLSKRYAVPDLDEQPGVAIRIWAVTE